MDEQKRKDIEKKARYECKKAYEELVEKGVSASLDDFLAVLKPATLAGAAVMKAVEDYHADLARRKAALDKQAAVLDEELEKLAAQLDELDDKTRNATSLLDLEAAAQYEEQAEPIRKEREALYRKRKIIDSSELRGDPEIYQRLQDAQERLSIARTVCFEYRATARDYIHDALFNLKELERRSFNYGVYEMSNYEQKKIDEVFHHFTGELTEEEKRLQAFNASSEGPETLSIKH